MGLMIEIVFTQMHRIMLFVYIITVKHYAVRVVKNFIHIIKLWKALQGD